METWLLWLIAAVIFGVGEIATLGFFLGPFAIGALLAALISAIGAGSIVSLATFLVVSSVVLGALRPLARAHKRQSPALRTGTAALIGRTATVLERISNDDDAGCVKLEGEVWRARAYDEDEVIEPGAHVQVIEIRGVTVVVAQ
jgi:membrane protein implicated in regulation of membrane protease activity